MEDVADADRLRVFPIALLRSFVLPGETLC